MEQEISVKIETYEDDGRLWLRYVVSDGRVVAMPVVYATLIQDRARITCPFCGKEHEHTPYEGSRLAHCDSAVVKKTYNGPQYYVRGAGVEPWLLQGQERRLIPSSPSTHH